MFNPSVNQTPNKPALVTSTVSTQAKIMNTIKHTAAFEIDKPTDKLFPLFSAEGEKLWVPGRDYENIMGEEVYDGLRTVIGPRKTSRFIEDLVRPPVVKKDMYAAYKEMAADQPGNPRPLGGPKDAVCGWRLTRRNSHVRI